MTAVTWFQERWQREWPDAADWFMRWWGVWLVLVVFIFSTPLSLIGIQNLDWPAREPKQRWD